MTNLKPKEMRALMKILALAIIACLPQAGFMAETGL
jgi:hypothetical protein